MKAMTSGTFTSDDARKLFEALCKSLESSVFDLVAPSPILDSIRVPTTALEYHPPGRFMSKMTRTRSYSMNANSLSLHDDEGGSTATLVPPAPIVRTLSSPERKR